MGSGKGNPEEWVAVVKPGRIMFEIEGVDEETAREALRLAISSCPSRARSSLVSARRKWLRRPLSRPSGLQTPPPRRRTNAARREDLQLSGRSAR